MEVWNAIRGEDWVLTAGTLEDVTRKLWNFDKPHRHAGRSLGTATQFGISLGVALANREQKRLVVDIQPDGDLMFDAGALWVAAKHRIPMLVVMYNNRAYYNDWEQPDPHGEAARHAGRPGAHRHGHERSRSRFRQARAVDGLVRRGPDRRPEESGGGLKRAIAKVKSGQPALIDTITQKRIGTRLKVRGARGEINVGMIGAGRMGPAHDRALGPEGLCRRRLRHRCGKESGRGGEGRTLETDLSNLARTCEVVLICVGYDRELRALLAADGGLKELPPGCIVAILSTVHPETVVELAALAAPRGVHVVDSTVCRGGKAADEGTLLSFVGGEAAVVSRLSPVLSAYSADIVHTGPVERRRSPRPRTT